MAGPDIISRGFSGVARGDGLFVAYFINDTVLKTEALEYRATRPAVLHIMVDTYDEVLKDLKDSEKAALTGEIDRVFEDFIDGTTLLRISSSRYLAVMEERHLAEVVAGKFAVLDRMREIGNENGVVTLSVGVGRGGATFAECEKMARAALDMALGRGGDQAAVRSADGGLRVLRRRLRAAWKSAPRSKAASSPTRWGTSSARATASLIMGHRLSDLDAIGAAIGVLRICRDLFRQTGRHRGGREKHTLAGQPDRPVPPRPAWGRISSPRPRRVEGPPPVARW